MMVVFLLDVIRSAVITVVELRKFEIRKRSKGGDFVVRRVQKGSADDGIPAILKPKPITPLVALTRAGSSTPVFRVNMRESHTVMASGFLPTLIPQVGLGSTPFNWHQTSPLLFRPVT